jgi:peptidoglycan/xylan/chitin deacetylase (PgdA/CDA1 family)
MPLELILTLHGVGTPGPDVNRVEAPYWLTTDAFDRLLDRCNAAATEKRWKTLITFDDGHLSHATVALPRLVSRGLTAVFFVCADRIGQPGYMTRRMVQDLAAAGMEIGSHGANHVDWRGLDSKAETAEYDDARKEIEDLSGHLVSKAAIPYGLYNRRVLTELKKRPFQHVYTCDRGHAQSSDWLKTRNTIEEATTEAELDDLFMGRTPWPVVMRRKAATALKRLR